MIDFLYGVTTTLSVEFLIIILICIFGGNEKW
jgi:hypothetical protein